MQYGNIPPLASVFNYNTPKQKSEVKDIDIAWATTKLPTIELSLSSDTNWCGKSSDWTGDCASYVAFCSTVPTSSRKGKDPNATLCWTDCNSYIAFVKTVPSHYDDTVNSWCEKTEDEKNTWLAAPENNLQSSYPCLDLNDWRNFLRFLDLYTDPTTNALAYNKDEIRDYYVDWDASSTDERTEAVNAYNTYVDNYKAYNDKGINAPACQRVDDVDTYVKCLDVPPTYPVQDCQDWNAFKAFDPDAAATFSNYTTSSDYDKRVAYAKYYKFTVTTVADKVSSECVEEDDDIRATNYPCKECSDWYEYQLYNNANKKDGTTQDWYNYDTIDTYAKRDLYYEYYSYWQKEQNGKHKCDTCVPLPTDVDNNYPCKTCGDWYEYRLSDIDLWDNNIDRKDWDEYANQTDDTKRKLYYDYNKWRKSTTTGHKCADCVALPDDLKPQKWDYSGTCNCWYDYVDWANKNKDADTDAVPSVTTWLNWNSVTDAQEKRKAYYALDKFRNSTADHTSSTECTSCVNLPDDAWPGGSTNGYPCKECGDWYTYRLSADSKYKTTTDRSGWEDYANKDAATRRELWYDYNKWRTSNTSGHLCSDCKDMPDDIRVKSFPFDATCGCWYDYVDYVDNNGTNTDAEPSINTWINYDTTTDKDEKRKAYYVLDAFRKQSQTCNECKQLPDEIYPVATEKFPCATCGAWYDYRVDTSNKYGTVDREDWTKDNVDEPTQRKLWYDYNKWRKNTTSANKCDACATLPTALQATTWPFNGTCECWYDFVDWNDAKGTDYNGDPEKWVGYAGLTDTADKRNLYYRLYEWTTDATNTTCNTCTPLPDEIKIEGYPCTDCGAWYVYRKDTANVYKTVNRTDWESYSGKTNDEKRDLWYDYNKWRRANIENDANTPYTNCKDCVELPDDIKPAKWEYNNDCNCWYDYVNWTNDVQGDADATESVNTWLKYTDAATTTANKRKAYYALYKFSNDNLDHTTATCNECKPLPTDIGIKNYPCDTCGDWYNYRLEAALYSGVDRNDWETYTDDSNYGQDKARALFYDYNKWRKTTSAKCDQCAEMPTELRPKHFPYSTTCDCWYDYIDWTDASTDADQKASVSTWLTWDNANTADVDNKRKAYYALEVFRKENLDHAATICTDCAQLPDEIWVGGDKDDEKYPCKDCGDWYTYRLSTADAYTTTTVDRTLWESYAQQDDAKKRELFYDYNKWRQGTTSLCHDCVSLPAALTVSEFPYKDTCNCWYDYIDWTDAATDADDQASVNTWLEYTGKDNATKRKAYYSLYKFNADHKDHTTTECTTCTDLPTDLAIKNWPCAECGDWYDYRLASPLYATADGIYVTRSDWETYTDDTSYDKAKARELFYDYNKWRKSANSKCTECAKLPDELKPNKWPYDATCDCWYDYIEWTDTNNADQDIADTVSTWLSYDTENDTEKKRMAYRKLYDFSKEQQDHKVGNGCDTCVAMPDDLKATDYPCTECKDWYEYLNDSDNAATGVTRELWYEYANQDKETKLKLQFDYHWHWQRENGTNTVSSQASCDTCYKDDETAPKFPCDNCDDWWTWVQWANTQSKVTYAKGWDSYDTLTKEEKVNLYDLYNFSYVNAGTLNNDPNKTEYAPTTCNSCVAAPQDVIPTPDAFKFIGWDNDDWATYQQNCGEHSLFENLQAELTTVKNAATAIYTMLSLGNDLGTSLGTYTPDSNNQPTLFTHIPYLLTQAYRLANGKYNGQDTENITDTDGIDSQLADAIYKVWIEHPNIKLAELYSYQDQFEDAYKEATEKRSVREIPTVKNPRACEDKYPEPEVWDKYKEPGVAYETWNDYTCMGNCDGAWCDYVNWVRDNMGQTLTLNDGENSTTTKTVTITPVVDESWITDWYAWDLYHKYPALSTDANATTDFAKENFNGKRDNCIKYKRFYCYYMNEAASGMPQVFADWWDDETDEYSKIANSTDEDNARTGNLISGYNEPMTTRSAVASKGDGYIEQNHTSNTEINPKDNSHTWSIKHAWLKEVKLGHAGTWNAAQTAMGQIITQMGYWNDMKEDIEKYVIDDDFTKDDTGTSRYSEADRKQFYSSAGIAASDYDGTKAINRLMYLTYSTMKVRYTWRVFAKQSTWDYIMFQCHSADWTGFTSMDTLGKTCDEYIKTYGAQGKDFRDIEASDIEDLKDEDVMKDKLAALKRLFADGIVTSGTSGFLNGCLTATKVDASHINSWERFHDMYEYFVFDRCTTDIAIPTETVTTTSDRDEKAAVDDKYYTVTTVTVKVDENGNKTTTTETQKMYFCNGSADDSTDADAGITTLDDTASSGGDADADADSTDCRQDTNQDKAGEDDGDKTTTTTTGTATVTKYKAGDLFGRMLMYFLYYRTALRTGGFYYNAYGYLVNGSVLGNREIASVTTCKPIEQVVMFNGSKSYPKSLLTIWYTLNKDSYGISDVSAKFTTVSSDQNALCQHYWGLTKDSTTLNINIDNRQEDFYKDELTTTVTP